MNELFHFSSSMSNLFIKKTFIYKLIMKVSLDVFIRRFQFVVKIYG